MRAFVPFTHDLPREREREDRAAGQTEDNPRMRAIARAYIRMTRPLVVTAEGVNACGGGFVGRCSPCSPARSLARSLAFLFVSLSRSSWHRFVLVHRVPCTSYVKTVKCAYDACARRRRAPRPIRVDISARTQRTPRITLTAVRETRASPRIPSLPSSLPSQRWKLSRWASLT